jgi:hypothetical protein
LRWAKLYRWCRMAGFDASTLHKSTSTLSYLTPAERKWWTDLQRERIEKAIWGRSSLRRESLRGN